MGPKRKLPTTTEGQETSSEAAHPETLANEDQWQEEPKEQKVHIVPADPRPDEYTAFKCQGARVHLTRLDYGGLQYAPVKCGTPANLTPSDYTSGDEYVPVKSDYSGDEDAPVHSGAHHSNVHGMGPADLYGEEKGMDECIADFFESRPFFYDITHTSYRNKNMREQQLAAFAASLGDGWTGRRVWIRFNSLRTDYVKLKKGSQGRKSGKGLTPLMQWKLQRMSFLDAHCKTPRQTVQPAQKPTNSQSSVGVGDMSGDSDLDLEMEELAEDLPLPKRHKPSTCSRPKQTKQLGSKRTAKNSSTDSSSTIMEFLSRMYKESHMPEKDITRKTEDTGKVDVRTSWGTYLMSVCLEVPADRFQQFQRETFEISTRYVPFKPLS